MAVDKTVTCIECGKPFRLSEGAFYNKNTRRYYCRSCGRKVKAEERKQRTGMRQTYFAMILKIVFGIAIIAGTVKEHFSLVALIVGLLLILWGLIPFIRARLQRRK